MSYRCDLCGKIVGNDIPCNKVVVETRPKTYINYDKKKKREFRTTGQEIVVEVKACRKCTMEV